MPFLIGILLALAVGLLAAALRMDRDRAFYPTLMMVIASYYVLFAVMGGSARAIVVESLIATPFVAAALWGFRRSAWSTAIALAAHGLLDLVHARVVADPGVPAWWPAFCLAYDVTAAAFLCWTLGRGRGTDRRA